LIGDDDDSCRSLSIHGSDHHVEAIYGKLCVQGIVRERKRRAKSECQPAHSPFAPGRAVMLIDSAAHVRYGAESVNTTGML
jgi:hypothetical protein